MSSYICGAFFFQSILFYHFVISRCSIYSSKMFSTLLFFWEIRKETIDVKEIYCLFSNFSIEFLGIV